MLDHIKSDYVRTAKAKGLDSRKVLYKHALRNALIPVVTGFGSFLGVFFAGSLIIERLFNLDGMGLLGFNAILGRDYPLFMGIFMITGFIGLLGRLISDLLYVSCGS